MTIRGVPAGTLIKLAGALIPLLLAALVTAAWQNSRTLAVMTAELEHVQTDLARRDCK
jgi:hypothetical protein